MIHHRLHFAARAAAAVFALASIGLASAQTKWDMPTAYPPSNYHTENIAEFVADIDKATGGKLKITVHNNASLFKANEIKRAVQGGQAQIGEILISNYSNEDPIYGIDSVPFLATSFDAAEKLWKASRKTIEDHFASFASLGVTKADMVSQYISVDKVGRIYIYDTPVKNARDLTDRLAASNAHVW